MVEAKKTCLLTALIFSLPYKLAKRKYLSIQLQANIASDSGIFLYVHMQNIYTLDLRNTNKKDICFYIIATIILFVSFIPFYSTRISVTVTIFFIRILFFS